MLWQVFLLMLICSTSNASRLLQRVVPHQVPPKYLLGSSRYSYKRTVAETNTATVNTSQRNNSDTFIVRLYFTFLPKKKHRLKKNNIAVQTKSAFRAAKSVLRTTKELHTVQFRSFPIQWMKGARCH